MAKALQDCIVLLGDSLTQRQDVPGNLQARMSLAYLRRLDVLNRGFGGYNTEWIRPIFGEIFAKKGEADGLPLVRMVTIFLGTNDSCISGSDHGVPRERFKENLEFFLTSLTSLDSEYAVAETPVSIVLVTPGPPLMSQLNERQRGMRNLEYTETFRQAVLDLGRKWKERETEANGTGWKITTVDFWASLETAARGLGEGLGEFYIDGLHLSTAGYTVLWDSIANAIRRDFKGRGLDFEDFEDLPFRVPWWDKVDPRDPNSVRHKMALPSFNSRAYSVHA